MVFTAVCNSRNLYYVQVRMATGFGKWMVVDDGIQNAKTSTKH